MAAKENLSPMMEQYLNMKRSLPSDVLLFFRLGDFYEMFFDDAKEASELLGLTLTRRQTIPMCGVPHHSSEGYITRLVKAGKRVAIAEQTTIPVPGKLVERELSRIISPGTLADVTYISEERNNFIVALYFLKKKFGLACIDHSTGEFNVGEFNSLDEIQDELTRISPSELLIAHEQQDLFKAINATQIYDDYTFIPASARTMLCDHFKVHSLDGFGCSGMTVAIGAAGAILHYLKYQLHRHIDHICTLTVISNNDFVRMDASSINNLDLVESRSGAKHSLLGAINRTSTPMGARKLRHWLLHPIRNVETIKARQDLISAFIQEDFLMSKLRTTLRGIRDLERLIGKLSQGGGNARDLQSLAASLSKLPDLQTDLSLFHVDLASQLLDKIKDFTELSSHIISALSEEPPVSIKEGGMIRTGYDPELDKLRTATTDGKLWIAELQTKERARTGIESLKIRFNNVFGYYIEITKSQLDKVPDDYTRKQTLVNAERFITPELKEIENTVLGAEERSRQIEYTLFLDLRHQACTRLVDIQTTAESLAEIDILLGLADLARQYNYTRPFVDDSGILQLKEARHPVIEQTLTETNFVPNDTYMEPLENRLLLLTGPNMAGKSTYIRQVALITVLAQIGSFVPAKEAHISIVDKIFCRVGASDDLARGQSTFMVEMSETALILNNATKNSLVILDEIGRGTATFDGLSIAWAVAEHLHDSIQCKALFATHYHELTDLSKAKIAVKNYNVAVREWNDEIVFLRKIVEGTADKSYGIQVARLAGIPKTIIKRATSILHHLESTSVRPTHKKTPPPSKTNRVKETAEDIMPTPHPVQPNLFDLLDN